MRISLSFLLLLCSARVFAQPDPAARCGMIRTANICWAQNDTAGALAQLERLDSICPADGLSSNACLKMGKIYLALGRLRDAERVARKGLIIPNGVYCIPAPGDKGIFTFNGIPCTSEDLYLTKANLCFLLSDLFKASPDSVFKYVLLADTRYQSTSGCGNALDAYHARLSPRLAQLYLDKGDTTAARNRLCRFLLENVLVAEKLKPLLMLSYSQQEITREVKRCIAHPRRRQEVRDGEKNNYLIFSLFGSEILYTSDDHRKGVRDYLKKNKSMRFLTDEPQITL